MQMPDVPNTARDARTNMTYNVMAYRKLSREEVLMAVAHYLQQSSVRRRKRPLRNQTVTILTVHGATPEL